MSTAATVMMLLLLLMTRYTTSVFTTGILLRTPTGIIKLPDSTLYVTIMFVVTVATTTVNILFVIDIFVMHLFVPHKVDELLSLFCCFFVVFVAVVRHFETTYAVAKSTTRQPTEGPLPAFVHARSS